MPSGRDFLVAAALVLLYDTWPAAAEEPRTGAPQIEQLPPVVVIDTTPVPPSECRSRSTRATSRRSLPRDLIQNDNLLDIPDLLYRNFGSVNINGSQGNPWQTDLTYRGFLASPLTGSPIGLSMYLDGMRFNDGFGETINWDLIPSRPSPTSTSSPAPTPSSG